MIDLRVAIHLASHQTAGVYGYMRGLISQSQLPVAIAGIISNDDTEIIPMPSQTTT